MANFSPGRPMPVFLDRQNRLECPAVPAPGCRSAREPGRVGLNAATTGTAGRRRLRVPMPATWASATAFSPDRPAKRPVGAADFTLEPGRAQPSRGESISFLSPARAAGAPTFCDATESRQRTQPRGLRPLGHPPPRLGSESPTEKIRPCAHPLEALQNPGWSAQRHRRGRRCKASRRAQPNFSAQDSAGISPLRTDATRQTGLLLENRDRRSRAPPPPPAEGRNFVAAPPATGPSLKNNLAPRS